MKSIFKILKMMGRQERGFFSFIISFTLITGLLPLANVIIPKLIFKNILEDRSLAYCLEMLFLLAGLNFINQVYRQYGQNRLLLIIDSFSNKMSFMITEKSLKIPISLSESKSGQDDLERANNASLYIYDLYDILYGLPYVISLISSLIILASYSLPLIGVILAISLINIPILKKISLSQKDYVDRNAPEERGFSYFLDFTRDFRYSKDIRLFRAKDMIMEKASFYFDRILKNNHSYFTKLGALQGLTNLVSDSEVIISFVFLSMRFLSGFIPADDLVLYVNAVVEINNSITGLQKNLFYLKSSERLFEEVFSYLDQEEGFLDRGEVEEMDLSHVSINFDRVSFTYPGTSREILHSCSFEIRPGETLALVGQNGAGKSTIVKLLCKFYSPTEGHIYLNGVDIEKINTRYYYQILSATFQDFRLFPFRISENVTSKMAGELKEEERRRMRETFAPLNLNNWISALPEEEDTYISNTYASKGVTPSGGLGQKLALARSMYHGGKFIIMDEPTSALDPRSEEEIFENMLKITKNQTSLFISHRLSSTRYADRILVLKDGVLVEEGDHESLLKEAGLYAKMYKSQADLYS